MRMRLAACLLALLAACGDDDADQGQSDAAVVPDAEPLDPPGCEFAFGRTFIADHLEIRPEDQGRDFTGDGVPDNKLGFLGSLGVNNGWAESIMNGWSIFLYDFPGLELPAPTTPTTRDAAFYNGIDEENPPVATDNLTGDGRFLVPEEQFDVSCHPTSRIEVVQDGLASHGTSPHYTFILPWVGTIEFVDLTVDFRFAEDLSRMDFDMTAIWTICGLSKSAFPGSTTGTMLDYMINTFSVPADIDRDGDGVEQVIGDGSTIDHCVDGDGSIVDGQGCPCDPRIADGYSVALRGAGGLAHIVGTLDTTP